MFLINYCTIDGVIHQQYTICFAKPFNPSKYLSDSFRLINPIIKNKNRMYLAQQGHYSSLYVCVLHLDHLSHSALPVTY